MFNFVKREVYSIMFAPSKEEITFLNKLSIYQMGSLAKDNLIFIDKKTKWKVFWEAIGILSIKADLAFPKGKIPRRISLSIHSCYFFFFFLTLETIHFPNSFSDIPILGNVNFLNKKTLRIKYFFHASTFITLTQCRMKDFCHLVSWLNQET